MKRYVLSVFFLALFWVLIPRPGLASQFFTVSEGETLYVIATTVNLRAFKAFKPDLNSEIVARLPIGTAVMMLDSRTSWFSKEFGRRLIWLEMEVLEGPSKGSVGYLVSEFIVHERPTLESLLAKYDGTPTADEVGRRMWAERAVAIDPSSTEAARRLKNSPPPVRPVLRAAVESGDRKTVERLINAGADVELDLTPFGTEGVGGITPLILALAKGQDDMATYLIERGANVNQTGWYGMGEARTTPLIMAVQKNNKKIVSLLLEKGANPNHCADGTPAILAVRNNDAATLKLLAASGADLSANGCAYAAYGSSALCSAANSPEMVKLLIELGVDVNRKEADKSTPLMCIVRLGSVESVRQMLMAGADPNATDRTGANVLLGMLRINVYIPQRRRGNVDSEPSRLVQIAKVLLEHGADPDMKDNKGQSYANKLPTTSLGKHMKHSGKIE